MEEKASIVGSFVRKENILCFLERARNDLKADLRKVFVHSIDTNQFEYLVTFRTFDKDPLVEWLDNFTIMHTKNGSFFSINALNKLIEKENGGIKPDKKYDLDWTKYQNKLIIVTNGELRVSGIKKVEDKLLFFKNQDI